MGRMSIVKSRLFVIGLVIALLVCGYVYFNQQAQLNDYGAKHAELSAELADVEYVAEIKRLQSEDVRSELNLRRDARRHLGVAGSGELLFIPAEAP